MNAETVLSLKDTWNASRGRANSSYVVENVRLIVLNDGSRRKRTCISLTCLWRWSMALTCPWNTKEFRNFHFRQLFWFTGFWWPNIGKGPSWPSLAHLTMPPMCWVFLSPFVPCTDTVKQTWQVHDSLESCCLPGCWTQRRNHNRLWSVLGFLQIHTFSKTSFRHDNSS